jgi:hypothetical protein
MNIVIQNITIAKNHIDSLHLQYMVALLDSGCLKEGINPFLSSSLHDSSLPHYLSALITENSKKEMVGTDLQMQVNDDLFIETPYFIPPIGVMKLQQCIANWLNIVSNRVIQLYGGLLDTLYIICNRVPNADTTLKFLDRYFIFSLLDILEEKYKYHTGYLVCSLLPDSTLPNGDLFELEKPGVFIGGWVYRMFRSKNVPVEKKIKLAMSLQNAKRAAAAISKKKQLKAVEDHRDNMLGKGYKATPDQQLHLPGVREKIGKLIELYYDPDNFEKDILDWRLPSISACKGNSRSRGGAMRMINVANMYDLADRLKVDISDEKDELKFFQEHLKLYKGHYGYVGTKENSEIRVPLYTVGFNLQHTQEILENYLYNVTYPEADFHKVLEPFKVRGITASDPYIYQLGRLIQKPLHSALRGENGPFRFIGKRHNVDDIKKVYEGTVFRKEEFENLLSLWDGQKKGKIWNRLRALKTYFVAGDYKSATDNMHPSLPRYFIKYLMRWTGLENSLWHRVLEKTLGTHKIKYGDLDDLEIDTIWGQLMGSPTSFPVLNLVNAAMFWQSVEVFERRTFTWNKVLKEYRPLFNGDDISFISNPLHYSLWEQVCTGCGLSLSPGKNYCTERFVNINSTNYSATLSLVYGTSFKGQTLHFEELKVVDFEQMFVVNSGLVKGQAKVQADSRRPKKETLSSELDETLMSVCDQLEECIVSALEDEKLRIYEVFHYHLKDRLEKSKRSWRLPRIFGGFGLPFGDQPSRNSLKVALKQLSDYKDLSDQKEKWLFNEYAQEYLNSIISNLNNQEENRLYRSIQPDYKVDQFGNLLLEDFLNLVPIEHRKIEQIPSKIVSKYSVEPLIYQAPSISKYVMMGSNQKDQRDKNGKRRNVEYRYIRALAGVNNKKNNLTCTDAEMQDLLDLVLNDNFKLISGGLSRDLKVSVD